MFVVSPAALIIPIYFPLAFIAIRRPRTYLQWSLTLRCQRALQHFCLYKAPILPPLTTTMGHVEEKVLSCAPQGQLYLVNLYLICVSGPSTHLAGPRSFLNSFKRVDGVHYKLICKILWRSASTSNCCRVSSFRRYLVFICISLRRATVSGFVVVVLLVGGSRNLELCVVYVLRCVYREKGTI